METQELDNLKMKTMKEIADANVLLADMKAQMKVLERDKDDFFKLREIELTEKLNDFMANSTGFLLKVENNYMLVHEFYETLKSYSDFLKEGQAEFGEVIRDFAEKANEFEVYLRRNTEIISKKNKLLDQREEGLNRDREFLRRERKLIENEQVRISSQQAQIRDALKQLSQKQ